MILKALCNPVLLARGIPKQMLLIMKLTAIILLSACLTANAEGFGQTISLSESNISLTEVFKKIEKQTDYTFAYTGRQLSQAKRVTLEINKGTLEQVLALCFKDQPFTYTIIEKIIVVKPNKEAFNDEIKSPSSSLPLIDITGRITNQSGEPMAGTSVKVKNTDKGTTTNNNGEFVLKEVNENATLEISFIGYETQTITVNGRQSINVRMTAATKQLDEMIIQAYGTTTRRFNTGNISKVSGEDIAKQPVSNPLAALQGRVPGLLITQTSGLNGDAMKVQIRGQNSLLQGSEPFYVVDGIPFADGSSFLNQSQMPLAASGISPFNLISPKDIESIEVLKDADATAIYGSRGAHGVILITTKKGKAGKTTVAASMSTGISKVTRTMDMLNTQQYIQMRREALKNDGLTPTVTNAPDILLWDTTRYTDLKKLFLGGSANYTDIGLSVSGGTTNTQFIFSANYNKQTNILSGDLGDKGISGRLNLNHASENRRFSMNLGINFSSYKDVLPLSDLSVSVNLLPSIKLYDSAGNLNWQEAGVFYKDVFVGGNPLATLKTKYTGDFQNFTSNLTTRYKILPGLSGVINLGYTIRSGDENTIIPSAAIDPYLGTLPSSYFGMDRTKRWILEPQLEYSIDVAKGKLDVLVGGTWQETITKGQYVQGTNYANDIFLNSIAGAGNVSTSNSYSQYRYEAFFGRLNYNFREKYIANITGRRDGSGRFGPSKRFSNFGAAGFAWIFSKENFFQTLLSPFSFGKIRFSYGATGSDQIGDYKFLDTWTVSPNTYQGINSINPTALFNPDYSWERVKKFEAALDLGLLKNRILISASYFRNICNNQIVSYSLPIQTGFNSIGKNLDAVIQNKGWELEIVSNNLRSKTINWRTSFNISIHRNKLVKFPGLASSSYANTYVIGQPVNIDKQYQFNGVNDTTGIYQFTDIDKSGGFNSTDRVMLKNTNPQFFGGLQNSFSYKQFELDIFFEFRKQTGSNYFDALATFPAGHIGRNQPIIVLDRWQKAGDLSTIQRFTATSSNPAYRAGSTLIASSDGSYSDASFLRLKNISAAYTLLQSLSKKIHIESCRFYIQAQNLFVITNYIGSDPETQSILRMPPLRTIVAGFQIKF